MLLTGVPPPGIMPAVSRPTFQRLVTIALACSWLLPGFLALAVVVHLELDHHDHGRSGDQAAELALTVEHGHSHEVGEPGHEHPANRTDRRQANPAPDAATGPPWGALEAWASRGAEAVPEEPGRPPPRPLFTLHCALLS